MPQDASSLPQGAIIAVDPEAVLVDRRVLAFRPPCLVAAMETAGRARLTLPEAAISRAEPLPAEQAVRFHFGAPPQAVSHDLGGEELGALLIAFCIGARVPLPARAAKSVSVTPWGVVMDFVVAFRKPPRWDRPQALPKG